MTQTPTTTPLAATRRPGSDRGLALLTMALAGLHLFVGATVLLGARLASRRRVA